MFVAEAQSTGKPKLLLSAATAPDAGRMAVYDLPQLNFYFDFINPMTYDMHGSW
jgi:GH18 family chitinase